MIWLLSSFLFIYRFFFSFFSFCEYLYASLCDFGCIALLLPFVRGFFLSGFFFFFSVYFSALVITGGFISWFGCSLLSFFLSFFLPSFLFLFFYYVLIFIILNHFLNFYFNNFILFYFSFFLSFFLLFLLSHVAERVLVLQPGVRLLPLRLESQVQDIGPAETS